MILTKKEILEEIKLGNLEIKPLNKNQINEVSIDLTLDNEFRIFDKQNLIKLDSDYKKFSKVVKKKELIIQPGDFVLGITKEKIHLPSNIAGLLEGRSRFARLGVLIHVSASIIKPGVNNKQVLEIKNLGNSDILLKAGTRICQLLLMRTESNTSYHGKFKKQDKI